MRLLDKNKGGAATQPYQAFGPHDLPQTFSRRRKPHQYGRAKLPLCPAKRS